MTCSNLLLHHNMFYFQFSNLPFFFFAPLLMYLNREYARAICPLSHAVFFVLLVIGAGSMYFHATLSLVGQLVDELAILWVVAGCIAVWMPSHHRPEILRQNR